MNKGKNKQDGHFVDLVHGIDDVVSDYVKNGMGTALELNKKHTDDFCKRFRNITNDNIVVDGVAELIYNFTCQTLNALVDKKIPISIDMMSYILLQVHNRFLFQGWKQAQEAANK